MIWRMSNWTFAWDSSEGDASKIAASNQVAGAGKWAGVLFGLVFAIWLFVYATGIFTTLGWVEGSERHDRFGVRPAESSSTGLSTMYLLQGQTAWWDYDIAVEGTGGVRLSIAGAIPRPDSMRIQNITRTGRGRLELVAPRSGLYYFRHQYVPLSGAFGRTPAGSTRYTMSWGVD